MAVAESLPYIVLGTVGRQLMDRFASLRALAIVDAARLVLVAALPWAWAEFGAAGLITSAALLGVGGALFDPNLGAMVPDLVRPGEVQAVSGLMDLTGRIARIAGPMTSWTADNNCGARTATWAHSASRCGLRAISRCWAPCSATSWTARARAAPGADHSTPALSPRAPRTPLVLIMAVTESLRHEVPVRLSGTVGSVMGE
ncbi:MFS transporter [Streptomyces sp. NRRL WC-3742]|uniref:MFS transporter n=1 Tax=Streptomyces sp. NRRL WC-3742 TaxID=1463934 RepID=UPI0022771358|nr:MFS transporter [Streptomyces sp. NRRL WC-3742]